MSEKMETEDVKVSEVEKAEEKPLTEEHKYTTVNAQISDIGLWFDGHANQACCKMYFSNIGGCCYIDFANLGAFVYGVFGKDKDVDAENGIFIESLKGKYVRVIANEKLRIVGIMNIINDGCVYMFEGKKPDEA